MSNSAKAAEAACKQSEESDPLTKEEIDAIQEWQEGKIEKIKFKTADEAIKWLNE